MITVKECEIWKGKRFTPWVKYDGEKLNHRKKDIKYKIIVFDLDETIGSFSELFILWIGIRQVESSFNNFTDLLNLYPEFFRPGILSILRFLQSIKEAHYIHSLILYTNNQCGKEWLSLLMSYIEMKCETKIFDQYIGAFDHNKNDQNRTTYKKTHEDLIKIIALPSEEVEICFIDDMMHPLMKHSLVYYICPRPYIHSLSWNVIIRRFMDQKWFPSNSIVSNFSFWKYWKKLHPKNHSFTKNVYLDILVSQKIVAHLKEFIKWGNPSSYKKKTLKKKTNLRRTRRLLRK